MHNNNEANTQQLGKLLGDLGHEIATPLASILLTSEMLADNTHGNLNDRQLRSLRNMIQAADEVQSLMKRVVLLTRLTTGQLSFESSDFALEELIEEIAGTHPTLEIRVLPPVPANLKGDRLRLRELLDLLIAFALNHDPAPELRIATWPEGHLSFALRAKGELAEKSAAEALDPFGPAGLKAARRGGGAGLELAIAARLVTALGGRFEIADPKEGKIALDAVFPLPS